MPLPAGAATVFVLPAHARQPPRPGLFPLPCRLHRRLYTLDLRRLRRTAAGLPFGAWAADMDRLSPGLRERLGAAAADYLSGPAALAHSYSHVRVRA